MNVEPFVEGEQRLRRYREPIEYVPASDEPNTGMHRVIWPDEWSCELTHSDGAVEKITKDRYDEILAEWSKAW